MPTKIEWATETWNPVTGCTKVSPGCKNCYAERMSKRLAGRFGYPAAPHNFDVTLHPDKLDQPLRWKKPRRVFVCSMGDLFHEDVSNAYRTEMFDVMSDARTMQYTFLVLTKRPELINPWENWVGECWPGDTPWSIAREVFCAWPPNIYLGVTAENQEQADKRIPVLLQTPAAVRFVSVEPCLSAIDLGGPLNGYPEQVSERTYVTHDMAMDAQDMSLMGTPMSNDEWAQTMPALDWVICGAETGPGARPMDLDWARSLRDQCQAARVPFFFKKDSNGSRLLDGREWNEYPKTEG